MQNCETAASRRSRGGTQIDAYAARRNVEIGNYRSSLWLAFSVPNGPTHVARTEFSLGRLTVQNSWESLCAASFDPIRPHPRPKRAWVVTAPHTPARRNSASLLTYLDLSFPISMSYCVTGGFSNLLSLLESGPWDCVAVDNQDLGSARNQPDCPGMSRYMIGA